MYLEELDEIDNKILSILEEDGRARYSEIGEQVNLTRVAVKNRISALEDRGIILGYKAIVNPTNAVEGTKFFIDIVTEPNHFNEVVDYLGKHGIIRKIYAVTGECRIHAEGFALSKKRYEMFMVGLRNNLEGAKMHTTQTVLYTIKDEDGGIQYDESMLAPTSEEREE